MCIAAPYTAINIAMVPIEVLEGYCYCLILQIKILGERERCGCDGFSVACLVKGEVFALVSTHGTLLRP